jgi:hypothetical protein
LNGFIPKAGNKVFGDAVSDLHFGILEGLRRLESNADPLGAGHQF